MRNERQDNRTWNAHNVIRPQIDESTNLLPTTSSCSAYKKKKKMNFIPYFKQIKGQIKQML